MIIHQIAQKPFLKYQGKLFSPWASVRLRAIETAPFLADRGHQVQFFQAHAIDQGQPGPDFGKGDIYVVQKVLYDIGPTLQQLRKAGKPIVVDLSDNVFQDCYLAEYYRNVLPAADLVTVSSEKLAEDIRSELDVPVRHIPDCVEMPFREAEFPAPLSPLRLLWFGRSFNSGPIVELLPALNELARDIPIELEVVTDPVPALIDIFVSMKGPLRGRIKYWTAGVTESALERCHAVLLPTSDAPNMIGKSANRLQETLWSGRLPIANPLPSFEPFADSAIITCDIIDAIRWTLAHQDEALTRIKRGQAYIANRYTPDKVAEIWESVLLEAIGLRRDSNSPS